MATYACGTDSCKTTLFWRRAVAGDPSPVTVTFSGNTLARIIGFRNVDTTTAFDATPTWSTSASDSTVEAAAITTVTPNTMLVFFSFMGEDIASMGVPVGLTTPSFPWTQAFYDPEGFTPGRDITIAAHYGLRGAVGVQSNIQATFDTQTIESRGVQIALRPRYATPSFNQSTYRLFNNANSVDVGAALAAQNTTATLASTGAAFRLRTLVHITNNHLLISGQAFKLQFAARSGTCDTGFSGETYADVTAATVIAYNDNATPTNGQALTATADGLSHGSDNIQPQTYVELNTFTNSVSQVDLTRDGKWDFALKDNGAPASTAYCFRLVTDTGVGFLTYTVIPEITTAVQVTFEQAAYRVFNNADSTDVGTALADQNTAAALPSTGAAFRLRMLLHVAGTNLGTSGQAFRLQYAVLSGACDTAFSGESYADVTASTPIAYKDNALAAEGTLTANGNDPTHGHTVVNQTYEELNNFTNPAAINVGQDGMWDFALVDNGAPVSTAYCFRVVKDPAVVLNTYTVIPQITTAPRGTVFYFHEVTTPNAGILPAATTLSTTTPNKTANDGTAGTNRDMNQMIGSLQVSAAVTTATQMALQKNWFRRFISRPLAAQTLPTGVWTIRAGVSESNLASNMFPFGAVIKVWRPSTGTTVATLLDNPELGISTNEPAAASTEISRTSTVSIDGVAVNGGDMLVVELWAENTQGSTTARTNTIFYDVTYAAATATPGTPGTVTLRWAPTASPVVIARKAGTFGANDVALPGVTYAATDPAGAATVRFSGTGGETSFTDTSGLANGTTYTYRVFTRDGTPCYATGSGTDVTGLPVASGGKEQWAYMANSGSALKAPIASDDGIYFGTNAARMLSLSASTGLQRWTPAATTSALQGWLIPVPLSAGGSRVFAGDQSGKVYSVDTSNGTIEFQPTLTGTPKFQAGASVQLRAYSPLGLPDSGYDLIYMATKNGAATTNNKVYALRSDTMAVKWTFNDGGAGNNWSVGEISGMPVVDYQRNLLYVTSLSTSGTGASLWIVDITTGLLVGSPVSCPTVNSACVNLGDIEASPAVSYDNATLLVSNTAGSVYAIDLAQAPGANMMKWTAPLALGAGNQVKGIIWEDWSSPGRLYMVVANTTPANSTVRCFLDPGVAGTPNAGTACSGWSGATVTVNGAQAPMLLDKLYVSSWNGTTGQIQQINFSNGTLGTPFTVGDGTRQPGDLSTDLGSELFVGTDEGKVFKITLPLP
jgi:outer membrane protein assembly factor BamB